jgi:hypothetical protein
MEKTRRARRQGEEPGPQKEPRSSEGRRARALGAALAIAACLAFSAPSAFAAKKGAEESDAAVVSAPKTASSPKPVSGADGASEPKPASAAEDAMGSRLEAFSKQIALARRAKDDDKEIALIEMAMGWAKAALDKDGAAMDRRQAILGLSFAFRGSLGPMGHSFAIEAKRREAAREMIALSASMLKEGERDPDLGLAEAAAYYGRPDTPRLDLPFASELAKQIETVQESQQKSGHFEPGDPAMDERSVQTIHMEVETLGRCQIQPLCRRVDMARLDAFSGAFGENTAEGRLESLNALGVLLVRWKRERLRTPMV